MTDATMLRRCAVGLLLFVALWLLGNTPASAACRSDLCVSVGQRPSDIDATQAQLLNTVLSALTAQDLRLRQEDYASLALGNVNLADLADAVQAQSGTGTLQEALASDIALSELFAAAAAVSDTAGDATLASAFTALSKQVDGAAGTLALDELLVLASGEDATLDVDLNALALVTGSAQVLNRNNLLFAPEPVPVDASVLGLDGIAGKQVGLQMQVIESPSFSCGPEGSTFRSAAMRIKLSITFPKDSQTLPITPALPDGNPTLDLTTLNIYVDVGATTGIVTAIDAIAQSATLQATPGLTNVYLGAIDDALFFSSASLTAADFSPATIATLTIPGDTVADVQVRSSTDGQSSSTETLVFNGPFPQTQTVGAGSGDLSGAGGQLIDNLELSVTPDLGLQAAAIDPVLDLALGRVLDAALQPALDGAIDPLLESLGAKPGAVPVTVDGFVETCTNDVAISGHVYLDGNRNATRDGDEGGTGENLWVKLVPAASPAGPAYVVAPVNATTGAWQAGAEPGTEYRVIVDTNDDPADTTATIAAGWIGTEHPTQVRTGVTANAAPISGLNFGLYRGLRVTGSVFRDNGSSANDGVQQADEPGLAGASVELRAADGGIVYDRVVTPASGTWTLSAPDAAVDTELQVIVLAPSGHLATGGSPGDSGGSYERSSDSVRFSLSAGADIGGMAFGEVPANRLENNGQTTATPGSVVFFDHRFVAGSAGEVRFDTSGEAAPTHDGWRNLLFVDADCNGQADPADTIAKAPVAVPSGSELCLVQKVFVPANAPIGAQFGATLTAEFDWTGAAPTLSASYQQQDRVTVGDSSEAGLKLLKEVDRAQARSGDTLTYTIGYGNQGAKPLQQIRIRDRAPAYTAIVDATCGELATGMTSCTVTSTPLTEADGGIVWELEGELAPGAQGTVRFTVLVQ